MLGEVDWSLGGGVFDHESCERLESCGWAGGFLCGFSGGGSPSLRLALPVAEWWGELWGIQSTERLVDYGRGY
ncbi:hypothetical protein RRSWK_05815 [Rhodopirellula sp. SWK7]|nr:hypothetical protein RRSWK_05815 [Rhodopirellula sp. SWK7]